MPLWTFLLLASASALAGVAGYMQPYLLRQGERMLYDVNAQSISHSPSPRIAIVLIGERTLAALGAWPFQRSHHAALLGQLRQARLVGLDILFPEPAGEAGEDIALAQAMAAHGKVVLAAHTISDPARADGEQMTILPVPVLFQAAVDIGYTNVDKDVDGLIRFARPIRSAGAEVLPSLAFSLARQALQEEGDIRSDGSGFRIEFTRHSVALDAEARLWFVPLVKGPPAYEYVDVLLGRVPPETFRDVIVLVGAAASGAADFQIVPKAFGSRVISGVHFNAEELRALLTGDCVRLAPSWVEAVLALVLALLCGLVMTQMRPVRGWLVLMGLCTLWMVIAWYLLTRHMLWIAGYTPVVGAVCVGTLMLLSRFVSLHESWHVQHISLGNIVYLDADEARPHTTLNSYLKALWKRVEAETGIRFLGGPLLKADLPEEFSRVVANKEGVLILVGPGSRRRMAVPLKIDTGTTYALFAWNRRISADGARAAAALVISATWFFHVQDTGKRQRKMLTDTIKAVFTALDYRDPTTGGHSTRVSEMCLRIMDRMDLSPQLYEDIHLGALIHDIGKIGIPDNILNKKASLSKDEFTTIRSHPNIAQSIMASVELPLAAFEAVYHHHERYDGTGYPNGLKGEEISLAGRIVAVADVYDAMRHARPYREGLPVDEVLRFMKNTENGHFDPTILQIFLDMLAADVEDATNQEAESDDES